MNNSLHRLIEGMVATMRGDVIPHLDTEFARGQAFGVIYMLKSIQLRASWSVNFVQQQLQFQYELADSLLPYLANLDAPPLPARAAAQGSADALEKARDDNDARICELINWHGNPSTGLSREAEGAIEELLRRYMDQQLKWELKTSAKPMFAEISSGSE